MCKEVLMSANIHGVYRMGRIEWEEQPVNIPDGSQVLITFIQKGHIDLQSRGIDQETAGELRSNLAMFAEDWDKPEMSVYDNYDLYKVKI